MIGIDINSQSVADALSVADTDRPYSDISNSDFQSKLVDSLVADDESVRPMASYDIDGVSDERLEEEWPNESVDIFEQDTEQAEPQDFDADALGQQFADEYEHEQLLNKAQGAVQQQEQQEPAAVEWTPREAYRASQDLERQVVESGLTNPESAERLAASLESVGMDASTVNAPALDIFLAKVESSGLDAYRQSGGDMSNLAPIQTAIAQEVHEQFNVAWRMEPTTPGDAQLVSRACWLGNFGFHKAVDDFGIDAPIYKLNPGQGAEMVVNAIAQAKGYAGPPLPREYCVQITNPIVERWREQLRQRLANEAESGETEQQQPARQTRRATSRFSTNRDIFDSQAEELYRARRGKL